MFVRLPMMMSSNGDIFRITGLLCGEFNSPHKGQWRGALIFSLIFSWINACVNNREAGDLRRHRVHHDVIVMRWIAHMWMPGVLVNDMSTFVPVTAWSNYPNQYWQNLITPYGVTGANNLQFYESHRKLICNGSIFSSGNADTCHNCLDPPV